MAFDKLFEPIKLGNVTLKNRIAMTAMGVNFKTPDHTYTDAHLAFYEARAKGGTGRYWTATTSADNSTCAYYMLIGSTGTCTCTISEANSRRYFGYMIRPVKDVAE